MSAEDEGQKDAKQTPANDTAAGQISLSPEFFAKFGVDPSEYDEKKTTRPKKLTSTTPPLLVKGVDINEASKDDLVREFRYIGDQLAYQIIRERDKNGYYLDVYDLQRVPGLGPRTFEKLTDVSWREGGSDAQKEVLNVLGFKPGEKVHTKEVAKRFSEMPGFDGCIIAHEDGYVLAAYWNHLSRDALGVFAPQFSKKLIPYVEKLNLGQLESLTMFIDERPITLVQCHDIVLAAVHKPNRFTRRQVRQAQQVVRKLRHLMLGEYASKIYSND